jgi:hypothetical protein
MGTRRSCLVLVLVLLPAGAWADRHNWEVSSAVSRVTGRSQLWGGNVAVAMPLRTYRKVSVFAEIAKHAGPHDGGSLTQLSALGGARGVLIRTLKRPDDTREHALPSYRLQFFAQAMSGLVQTTGAGTDSAWGAGGGVDGLFSEYGGLRAQVDYVHINRKGGGDGFVRFSVGLVYRFEKY